MKWKEVRELIQAQKGYINGDLSYEDVQRTLYSVLKFNKIKLSLDASLENRGRHISLILPNNDKVALNQWINNRVKQKELDLEITLKHLSFVIGNEQVIEVIMKILKRIEE